MRNVFEYYKEDDFLAHHGIKGQKWGIRRFQNLDGTLTDAGRERYGKALAEGIKKADAQGISASDPTLLLLKLEMLFLSMRNLHLPKKAAKNGNVWSEIINGLKAILSQLRQY